jgi:hypothetical protein
MKKNTFFTAWDEQQMRQEQGDMAVPQLYQIAKKGICRAYFKNRLTGTKFSKMVLFCRRPHKFTGTEAVDRETDCIRFRTTGPYLAAIPLEDENWKIVGLPHMMMDPTNNTTLLYNKFVMFEIELDRHTE